MCLMARCDAGRGGAAEGGGRGGEGCRGVGGDTGSPTGPQLSSHRYILTPTPYYPSLLAVASCASVARGLDAALVTHPVRGVSPLPPSLSLTPSPRLPSALSLPLPPCLCPCSSLQQQPPPLSQFGSDPPRLGLAGWQNQFFKPTTGADCAAAGEGRKAAAAEPVV